jgi:hypothetical protein
MHGSENQMPGLTGSKRCLHGVCVTQLTDKYHIRVLAHRSTQPDSEGGGVTANLTLAHHGQLVTVHILDWVLDCQDMLTA